MGIIVTRGEVMRLTSPNRLAELYAVATRGMKRKDVMAATGIRNTTLERIQQGNPSVSQHFLLMFAVGLGLQPEDVFQAAGLSREEVDIPDLIAGVLSLSRLSRARRVRLVSFYHELEEQQAAEEEKRQVA